MPRSSPPDDLAASRQQRVTRRGEPFEDTYVSLYPDMVRLAYFLIGSIEPAREIAQDAFARLFERRAAVEDPVAFVRTCVLNRCRSWHRSRYIAVRYRARLARADAHLDDPAELTDVLARLPRRRREVVVLRFHGGLSLHEIATQLGISEGTVKSTLHRALDDLRGDLS